MDALYRVTFSQFQAMRAFVFSPKPDPFQQGTFDDNTGDGQRTSCSITNFVKRGGPSGRTDIWLCMGVAATRETPILPYDAAQHHGPEGHPGRAARRLPR